MIIWNFPLFLLTIVLVGGASSQLHAEKPTSSLEDVAFSKTASYQKSQPTFSTAIYRTNQNIERVNLSGNESNNRYQQFKSTIARRSRSSEQSRSLTIEETSQHQAARR